MKYMKTFEMTVKLNINLYLGIINIFPSFSHLVYHP